MARDGDAERAPSGFGLRVLGRQRERPSSAMTPEGEDTAAILAGEAVGQMEKPPEEGGPIVACKFDEAGFLHQAAEFDELARAFPSLTDPVARVLAGHGELSPGPHRRGPGRLARRGFQPVGPPPERAARLGGARRP
jgi:hypothetical protein